LGLAPLLRRRRILADTSTSKAQGVFIGFVEIKGTAESAEPFTSYLAAATCVHFGWEVDEAWSRTVTETYTDSKGETKTRQIRESGGTTVAQGGESKPFYLRDETGVILVRPKGAGIEAGAFTLTAGANDAALLVSLAPGLYSAQVTSADGTTGTALVEFYELP